MDSILEAPVWRKASSCPGTAACVEVADLACGDTAMRDNKNPDGPVLRFGAASWAEFIAGVRAGEFG